MSKTDEILGIIKNEIDENNIREYVLAITNSLNELGKNECNKSTHLKLNKELDGDSDRLFKLGSNRFNSLYGPTCTFSSDKKYISDNIHLAVAFGLDDVSDTTTGDLTDAYEMLIRRIKKMGNTQFEDIMQQVFLTVCDYFGKVESINTDVRELYYSYLDKEHIIGKISDFKSKDAAACVERAALSQNLLQILGYDSVYKTSQVFIDDSRTGVHSYNLVSDGDKYYMFDSTIPKVNESGVVTPLVAEITKEVFDKLSHPYYEDDIAVLTERDAVYGHIKIKYNSWSDKVFDTTKRKLNDSNDQQSL